MNQQNPIFDQARLKHKWANHHISQLQSLWNNFRRESDLCRLVLEEDTKTGANRLSIRSDKPLPSAITLLVGDAIHSLKCALDYTISTILGGSNTRITFPMGEEREEVVNSFRTNGADACVACGRGGKGRGRNASIEEAIPGIGKFITDEIRPYKAAGGLLWPLNKLDVRDKHRLLVPVVAPLLVEGLKFIDNHHNSMNITISIDPGGDQCVYAGGIITKVQDQGKLTFDIFLNEPGIIEYASLFPTLINMSQAVAETIGSLEDFVRANSA